MYILDLAQYSVYGAGIWYTFSQLLSMPLYSLPGVKFFSLTTIYIQYQARLYMQLGTIHCMYMYYVWRGCILLSIIATS